LHDEYLTEVTVKASKSLRGKFIATMLLVTGLIGVATLVIVSLLSAQASSRQLATVRYHIEEGIKSKGRVLTENHALAMRTMVLDNAFLDMQRLVERAVKEDEDLVYGIYINNEKAAVAFCQRGANCSAEKAIDREIWRHLGLAESELVVDKQTVHRAQRLNDDLLEVAMPVYGDDKEVVGSIRYALSTRRMHEALAQAQADAKRSLNRSMAVIGGMVGLAVLLALVLSRFQAVRITRPVSDLTAAAEQLASGNRSVRVKIDSGDELERLGESFNRMVEDLAASYGQLEEMNRTLEHKVQARTLELAAKNRDMRLVLDNVDQGFVTLSAQGTMATERSRVVDDWFGLASEAVPLWEFMAPLSRPFSLEFRLAWEQVMDGFLPVEITLEQLPRQLTIDSRTFSCRYIPLAKEGEFDGVLLVIDDITEKLAKEREEAEQNELMQGFKRLMLDRSGFTAFHREAGGMVANVCEGKISNPAQLKMVLHTLKGNSAVMGLVVVARLCHTLEDQIAESGVMSPETLEELEARWAKITEHIATFAGLDKQRVIEIPQVEYAAMIAKLSGEPTAGDVLNQLLSWQLEPVERAFERLAEQGRALAKRLGKGDLSVVIEGNGVRLDPDTWSPFFSSMVHLIRNALDHGIEAPAERGETKKPAHGSLLLRAEASGSSMTIEIGDDGRGIDFETVAKKAKAAKLPYLTRQDLINALLAGGLSTKDDVSDVSGRGIGMSAVRQQIEAMEGTIDLRSVKGKGTTWIIRFPWSPARVPTVRLRRSSIPAARRSLAPQNGRS
jgi:two-component system chemotaxis sensor kinase CheA